MGNAKIYTPPIWQFDLKCSDGRAITGQLKAYDIEGKAFTNRNEKITFTVAKKNKILKEQREKYEGITKIKPELEASSEKIQVIMP